jgi:hypothetical protein
MAPSGATNQERIFMAQHVTVILVNGSKSHFHEQDSVMYDHEEGVLVINDLTGATINFIVKDTVLAWITEEMTADEVHAYLQRLEDQKNGIGPEEKGDSDGLGV